MLMAFATDRTGIATGYSSKFLKNPEYYSRNFLVGLGPHSNPLFLFKGENDKEILITYPNLVCPLADQYDVFVDWEFFFYVHGFN